MSKNFLFKLGGLLLIVFLTYGFSINDDGPGKSQLEMFSQFNSNGQSDQPMFLHTPSNERSILSGYFTQGFEDLTFPPSGWSVYNVAGPSYTWARSTAQFHSGVASAFIRYDAVGGGGQDWLVTPRFTVASTDSVVFWMRLAFQGYQPDSLSVKVSTTDSLPGSFTGTILSLREGTNYPPNSTTWYRYAAYLGGYAGQNVYVAFKHANVDGDGLYIDDVAIGTPPANDIKSTSVDMPSYTGTTVNTPKGTFTNVGTNANAFPVTMTISPGGYTSTKNVPTLNSGASTQVTFDNWTPSTAGTYNITMISQLGTDQDRTNDTIKTTINVFGSVSNNGWTGQTMMAGGRWAHGLAFYRSGTYPNDTGFVYAVTGFDASFANTTLLSRYNTVTGVWQDLAPIPTSRTQVSAVTVGTKIYVPGGYTGSFSPTNQLAIYDIPTNTWTTGAILPQAVGDYAIGVRGDYIYVMGGYSGSTDVNLVQVYNTVTNTWTSGTAMTGTSSAGLRGAIVGNKIVVTGGYSQTLAASLKQTRIGTIDENNPALITWTAGPDFPYTLGRHGGTSVDLNTNSGATLNKQYALFTGGDPNGAGTSVLNGTFVFDFSNNTWLIGPNKPSAVSNICNLASFQKGDSLYVMSTGGYNGTSILTVNEMLNLGAVPVKPALVTPANGSGAVTTTTTLDWNDASHSQNYKVQLATDAGFTNIIRDTTVSASTVGIAGLSNNTQYYWRVRGQNSLANSGYSNTFNFTTQLAPPSLVSPADGSIGQQVNLNFSWNSVSGALTYHIQIASDSLFSSIVVNDSTLAVTNKNVTGLTPLTRYWWRVRGKSAGGNGEFSSVYDFKTIGPPFTIALVNPSNNAVNQPVNLIFNWLPTSDQTRPVIGIEEQIDKKLRSGSQTDERTISNYWFELVTDTSSMANLMVDSTITDTTTTVNGLNNITSYFWRVRAKNEIGYGAYSTWFKFTTIVPVPAAPSLVSPSNGATGQSLTTDLVWNGVQYATNYRVQVATDAGFTNLILNDSTVTDTTKSVTGLNTFTQYHWRVLAKNINGSGSYSPVWTFTTIVDAPAAPNLVAPANNSTGIELTPTMDWDSVAFAETFRLVIASDTAFNNVVLDTAGINVSQFTVPSGVLANSIKYYWRVNASSAGGSGNFSVAWNFTTAVLPPSAPVLTSPENNSIGQSLTPLLEWDSLASANTYIVQLSEDSTFATTLISQTGITMAQFQVNAGVLLNETKYYWRVSATNTAGTGAYSEVWNFMTFGVGINTISGVIPQEYKLYNNYPNPFNPSTKIKFDIPKASFVSLKIYDMSGREIAKLVDGNLSASAYEFTFNASSLPSGVYFYRLQTDDFVNTMRMVLVK